MIELQQGSVLERAMRLIIGAGLVLSQDADGIATLDTAAGAGISQAAADIRYVNIDGDTMTGLLNLVNLHATARVYVGTAIGVAGLGAAALSAGDGSNIGSVEWWAPSGVRQGYMGFGASGVNLVMEAGIFSLSGSEGWAMKSSLTTSGYVALRNSADVLKGYFGWDATGVGIWDSAGQYRVTTTTTGGTLYGGWSATSYLILSAAQKLYLDGGSDTYIWQVSADNLALVAGGLATLTLTPGSAVFAAVPVILQAASKLYLDGGSDTYLVEAAANLFNLVVGGATVLAINPTQFQTFGDVIVAATKKFYLDGGVDTYIYESSANRVDFVVGGVTPIFMTTTAVNLILAVTIQPTNKLYFDGGGDTYLSESAANTLRFVAGGANSLAMNATKVVIPSGVGFYLDDGGDTYFTEFSPNLVNFYAGGVHTFQYTSTYVELRSGIHLRITGGNALYLDGGNDTYLVAETSGANVLDFVLGGAIRAQWGPTFINFVNGVDLAIPAGKRLYLDGGGDTYIYQQQANVLDIVAGGTARVSAHASGGSLYGDWFVDDGTATARRVAKIIVSSSSPSGTAPEGTIWIRT